MRWTPEAVATITSGTLVRSGGGPIAGAFFDSRKPLVGGLFVPIVAARDGHDFLDAAIDAGASAVLTGPARGLPKGRASVIEVANPEQALATLARHARQQCTGPVVAITGSNGKTTTRALIEAVVTTRYERVVCTQGNFNNHLGVPLTILGKPHRPDAMVLEFGMSAPGENRFLAQLAGPTVSVITSIALEHLEFMGSLAAIAEAEAEVIGCLPEHGLLVAPADESLLTPHLQQAPAKIRQITFANPGHGAVVEVAEVVLGASTRAKLRYRHAGATGVVDVHLQLFGAHNARNAAAALAVGLGLGLDPEAMARAMAQVQPVGDRGRVLRAGSHHLVADCYNANPGSVEAALRSLAAVPIKPPAKRVAILGDMLELGPDELRLHADMGRLAASLGIDALVGIGPRTRAMVAAADAAGMTAWHAGDALDQEPQGCSGLATELLESLKTSPGSWLLIKGSRGNRLERLLDPLIESSAEINPGHL